MQAVDALARVLFMFHEFDIGQTDIEKTIGPLK